MKIIKHLKSEWREHRLGLPDCEDPVVLLVRLHKVILRTRDATPLLRLLGRVNEDEQLDVAPGYLLCTSLRAYPEGLAGGVLARLVFHERSGLSWNAAIRPVLCGDSVDYVPVEMPLYGTVQYAIE